MKISLRKKDNTNGKTSLFLEYYSGYVKDSKGKIKHNRKYEFLDIQVYTKPKNADERTHNKKLFELAENILKKKQVESLKDDFEINTDKSRKIKLIDFCQKYLTEKNFKKGTDSTYEIAVNKLLNYCNPETTTLKNIDEAFIQGYKSYLDTYLKYDSKQLSNNTKYSYFSIFKIIITQAYKRGLISKNPFLNIKNFSYKQPQRTYLTIEEIQKLEETECKKPIIKQAFLFSCFSGLRFSDVQLLEWNQIEKEGANYKIIFRQKKTGEQEYLSLGKQAVEYLGKRGKPEERVFKGLVYNPYLNAVITKWVFNAGINKDITFHSARHTFATMLLTNDVDIYTVSKLLGHKKLETTQVYAKIINQKMIEAVNKIPKLN